MEDLGGVPIGVLILPKIENPGCPKFVTENMTPAIMTDMGTLSPKFSFGPIEFSYAKDMVLLQLQYRFYTKLYGKY